MEGWLAKKKGKADKWERKLVVLLGDVLQYYAPLIKGNMLIEGAVYIEKIFANNTTGNAKLQQLLGTIGADEEKGLPRKYLANRFKVIAGDKKDTLVAAETSAEMDRWIAAFKSRALKDTALHTTIEGWLMKKEEANKTWVKRYCVLIDDRLWIYEMLPKVYHAHYHYRMPSSA
jgi:hypothetical protein